MPDPLVPNRDTETAALEDHLQRASQRMGSDYVRRFEGKLTRDMAMGVDGKPVALPWATSANRVGDRLNATNLGTRIFDKDGQVEKVMPSIPLTAAECEYLDKGVREAETIEMVNQGLGVPTTEVFDEGDHFAAQTDNPRCTGTNDAGHRCIMRVGHWGTCTFNPSWDRPSTP